MRRKQATQDALRREVDLSGLQFPDTWTLYSQLWAVRKGMTQAEIDEMEVWLIGWRERRDRLQAESADRDVFRKVNTRKEKGHD